MPLTAGARVGPYEIVSALGAGGMGEVYRARDTRLDRAVAIKILSAGFASDPERLARFDREAKTLAALNHPHIAQIYGLEAIGPDGCGLVLELVDGDDLSDRIARGAMPLDEALPIASQMADALEAAHEQGIIHRDLKPANVKVRADGTVKVLDFGLAKAFDPMSSSSGDAMNSPTLTVRGTQLGMIVGTAAYMAPEQAKGKAVDKRADIWAFGVVLYEMLTGERAFKGDDISETLASVLKDTPPLDSLPAAIPTRLKELLKRCLERDVKMRLRDIGEARVEIARIQSGSGETKPASPAAAVAVRPSLTRRALPWAVAAVFGVALIAALAIWAPWRRTSPPTPRKLLVSLGADATLAADVGAAAVLSPDGKTLAFAAQTAGPRLFTRRLDQLQATVLAGTEEASSPFFSPDGQWIAFFTNTALKKIPVTGGAAISLCPVTNGRGGAWTDDDTIIFTPSNATNVTLMRVAAAGGTPETFGVRSKGATTQRWPQWLPGGKGVLFTEHSVTSEWDNATIVVAPSAGGTPKVVVRGGHYGRYVASGSSVSGRGHVIYMNQGRLFAVRFDLNRLEPIGQPVPVVDGISSNAVVTGGAQFAVSAEGTLAYVPGAAISNANPIDWMTRDGKTAVLRAATADWANPRFSPDGRKLALEIFDGKQRDIWIYEWERDTLTQLTFDPGQDVMPVWTPDGRHIVFSSDRPQPGVRMALYWVNADGSGDVTRLTEGSAVQVPRSWHPSGKFLAFMEQSAQTTGAPSAGLDLMILPMEGDAEHGWKPGKPTPFLATPFNEIMPTFSPDGRWIAYFSNESRPGLNIYVRPFPGPGGKWRVSLDNGTYPVWSATTHELLWVDARNNIMTSKYDTAGDSFRAGKPENWAPGAIRGPRVANMAYDLHPDGKRLAIVGGQNAGGAGNDKLVFVFNFVDELARIAPLTK